MFNSNILFLERTDTYCNYITLEKKTLDDLYISTVAKLIFKHQNNDADIFLSGIRNILTDDEAVKKRQEMVQILMQKTSFMDDLLSLCEEVNLIRSGQSSKEQTGQGVQDSKVYQYCIQARKMISAIAKLKVIIREAHIDNCIFCELADEINDWETNQKLASLIKYIVSYYEDGNFRININFRNDFRFENSIIESIGSLNLSENRNVDKITQIDINCDNYIVRNNLSDIDEKVTQNLVTLLSPFCTSVYKFFNDLAAQVNVYKTFCAANRFIDHNCENSTLPKFDKNCYIEAENLSDLFYRVLSEEEKNYKKTIPNNLTTSDAQILVITGPNQGGKTTFLRSVGIAQIFAQSGLFVAAKEYKSYIFKGFVIHFPELEDESLNYGKFAHELVSLREKIAKAGGNKSLYLFNEAFASTSEAEGSKYAEDLLCAISNTDSLIVFVTHLLDLAFNVEKLNNRLPNGKKAVNLIADIMMENENSPKRTYRIIRGMPQQRIFTKEFFNI